MSNPKRPIDVSTLPNYGFGKRDPINWGVAMLILIELTSVMLVFFSFFFSRMRTDLWPPTGMFPKNIAAGAMTTVLLLASAAPAQFATRAAKDGHLRGMQVQMVLVTALSVAAVLTRACEFAWLPFRWDANVYGSVVWAALVLHTLHLASGAAENALVTVLLFKGPVLKKHLVDVEANGMYWFFVVGAWIPQFFILYLEHVIFR